MPKYKKKIRCILGFHKWRKLFFGPIANYYQCEFEECRKVKRKRKRGKSNAEVQEEDNATHGL